MSDDRILFSSLSAMYQLLGFLIAFPIIVYLIEVQDKGITQLTNSGIGELDAKVVMYYFVAFVSGLVGYFIGKSDEPE